MTFATAWVICFRNGALIYVGRNPEKPEPCAQMIARTLESLHKPRPRANLLSEIATHTV